MVGTSPPSSLPPEALGSLSSTNGHMLDTQSIPLATTPSIHDTEIAINTTIEPTTGFASTTDPQVQYTEALLNSLISLYNKMTGTTAELNTSCHADCSGRGECLNGTCFCLVQYEGESCHEPNVAYFASFSCIFFIIAAISLGQLVVCVRAEYLRMKTPSFRRACSVTTQKLLYIITFVAAAIRGAYFSSPSNAELTLASSFLSSFYPVILSAGSLIVCFWAEAFHLRDVRCERPRFLGKSFLGFVTFNVITYSLFAAEVFLQRESPSEEERKLLAHIFNGCYAVLMFIMVVFFLIYGVEVYFKVRGGFVSDTVIVGTLHSRLPRATTAAAVAAAQAVVRNNTDIEGTTNAGAATSAPLPRKYSNTGSMDALSCSSNSTSTTTIMSVGDTPAAAAAGAAACHQPLLTSEERLKNSELLQPAADADESQRADGDQNETADEVESNAHLLNKKVRVGLTSSSERGIDYSQLSQSRFGLVFQACMLMITVCFLFSDVLGGFWKNRVPLISRNAYDIVFRVVELGVALWFPCVLWNCIAPEQLWILNPRKILKQIDIDKSVTVPSTTEQEADYKESSSDSADAANMRECWICYDTSSNTEAGPMIEPCLCRGDVAAVHHNCLRHWLMECAQNNNTEQLACKVCQAEYDLERSPHWWLGQGFTARHWLHTASLVTIMCATIATASAVLQMYQDAMVRSVTAGAMLLMIYICLRFLGFNTYTAYQRARYSAVKILNRHFIGVNNTSSSDESGSSESSSSTGGGSSSSPSSPSHSVSSAATDNSDLYPDAQMVTNKPGLEIYVCGEQASVISGGQISRGSVSTISGGQVTVDITSTALPS